MLVKDTSMLRILVFTTNLDTDLDPKTTKEDTLPHNILELY